jgi:uncharacterized protein YjbI with pentapeptide repeats
MYVLGASTINSGEKNMIRKQVLVISLLALSGAVIGNDTPTPQYEFSGEEAVSCLIRNGKCRDCDLSKQDLRAVMAEVNKKYRRRCMFTDLSGSNLSGADLSGVDLSNATMYDTNLSGANLSGANLSNTLMEGVNLSGANLTKANMTYAGLAKANLTNANMSSAIMDGACLANADLSGANVSGANIAKAWGTYTR